MLTQRLSSDTALSLLEVLTALSLFTFATLALASLLPKTAHQLHLSSTRFERFLKERNWQTSDLSLTACAALDEYEELRTWQCDRVGGGAPLEAIFQVDQ